MSMRLGQNLIHFPSIKFLTAPRGFKGKCPRCRKKFAEDDRYVEHSEGNVHVSCLRTGKTKRYVGSQSHQPGPRAA